LYFAILYAVCFTLVAIFDSEWVTVPLGALVTGIGIGEINGLSVLPFLRRYFKKI
jgi:hypothetical protein